MLRRLVQTACWLIGPLLIMQSLALSHVRAQHDPAPVLALLEQGSGVQRLALYSPETHWRRILTPTFSNLTPTGPSHFDGRHDWLSGLVASNPGDIAGGQDFGRPYRINWAHLRIEPLLSQKIPTSTVTWSPDRAWMAYYAPQADGTIQAFRMRADGQGILNLSALFDPPVSVNVWERPVFSGDGQWIYFHGQAGNQNAQLYRVRVDGTDGQGLEAQGFPNGSVVQAPAQSHWMLMEATSTLQGMVNTQTGTHVWFSQVDAYGAPPSFVTWVGPDLFLTEGGPADLSAWQAGATTPYLKMNGISGFRPTWSGWLFVTTSDGDVFALTVDGQRRVNVTLPVDLIQPEIWTWSADGLWLIVAVKNQTTGGRELWRITDGAMQKMGAFAGFIKYQATSPDGRWVYFTELTNSRRLYRMRDNGTALEPIAPHGAAWGYSVVDWVTLERDWSVGMLLAGGVGLVLLGFARRPLMKILRSRLLNPV